MYSLIKVASCGLILTFSTCSQTFIMRFILLVHVYLIKIVLFNVVIVLSVIMSVSFFGTSLDINFWPYVIFHHLCISNYVAMNEQDTGKKGFFSGFQSFGYRV